jgi:hypothetical protein
MNEYLLTIVSLNADWKIYTSGNIVSLDSLLFVFYRYERNEFV